MKPLRSSTCLKSVSILLETLLLLTTPAPSFPRRPIRNSWSETAFAEAITDQEKTMNQKLLSQFQRDMQLRGLGKPG
jgi:hypothetical protein